MLPKKLSRSVMVVVTVLALATMLLAPAAAGAVELGFDVRFNGVVETVGTETDAWVIGGQTLTTDENTVLIKLVEPVEAGLWAEVAAKKQSDGSLLAKQITVRKEQVRLRGVLSEKPEGDVGAWVIAGVTVQVTEETQFSSRSGEIAVGKWVQAVMTEDGGVLTAFNIVGIGDQDAVTVSGEIQEVTDEYWVVSGITLWIETEVEPMTLISGAPVVGLIAHAAAELQEDSTLLATVLRVAWIERAAPAHATDFKGVVTAIDFLETRLPRMLTVESDDPAATYSVQLMPNTRIHQEKGLLMVDATVHVIGWQLEDGKVIASEVTVLESPEEGGEFASFEGVITSLPTEGPVEKPVGVWMLGEQKIVVSEQTQVFGHTPVVGAWAVVGGIQRSDGSILAGRVTVLSPR